LCNPHRGTGAQDGTAFTLIMPEENRFAGDLVAALEVANQVVPHELLLVAQMVRVAIFLYCRHKANDQVMGMFGVR
jgi:hypothetical protein